MSDSILCDIESFKELTDEEILKIVRERPWMIAHLPDERKTEEICLAAVKKDGDVLQFISHASYDVIKAAIMSDPFAVQWIENLPLELLLLGISAQPGVIKYVTDPPIEAIAVAIFKDSTLEDNFDDHQLQLASDYIDSVLTKEVSRNAKSESV